MRWATMPKEARVEQGEVTIEQILRERWDVLAEEERRAAETLIAYRQGIPTPKEAHGGTISLGSRLADDVTRLLGSWRFIIIQSLVLTAWVALNITAWVQQWDPYPFILLNLMLSFQAAYSSPIIMMSQNRREEKDRLKAESDYRTNMRAELLIADVHARLDEIGGTQWAALLELQQQQLVLLERIERLTDEVRESIGAQPSETTGEVSEEAR